MFLVSESGESGLLALSPGQKCRSFTDGRPRPGCIAFALSPQERPGESSQYVQKYMTDDNYDVAEKLEAWAGDRDRSLYELAEAWLMAQPSVCSVISGATKVEHVLSNAKAAGWSLTDDELEEIEMILSPG